MELDELVTDDSGHLQWKHKARWIKYEEDVELGGQWSKPHVSTLSFHSLMELRKLIEDGIGIYDLDEQTMPDIIREICTTLVEQEVLTPQESGKMEIALMFKQSL